MASVSYLPIPTATLEVDDSSTTKNQGRQHPRPHWSRGVWCTASVLYLSLLLLIAVIFASSTTTRRRDPQSDHIKDRESCGNSAAEAKSLGCVFDLTLLGWVPWRCYNAALAAELLHHAEWQFYLRQDSTQPISADVVLAGKWDAMYVQHEFYIERCTYAWRKTREVALSGEILDGYLADSHQTNHCEMMLLRRTQLNDTGSVVYNKFVTCPRTRGTDGRFGWYRVVGGKKIYRQP